MCSLVEAVSRSATEERDEGSVVTCWGSQMGEMGEGLEIHFVFWGDCRNEVDGRRRWGCVGSLEDECASVEGVVP